MFILIPYLWFSTFVLIYPHPRRGRQSWLNRGTLQPLQVVNTQVYASPLVIFRIVSLLGPRVQTSVPWFRTKHTDQGRHQRCNRCSDVIQCTPAHGPLFLCSSLTIGKLKSRHSDWLCWKVQGAGRKNKRFPWRLWYLPQAKGRGADCTGGRATRETTGSSKSSWRVRIILAFVIWSYRPSTLDAMQRYVIVRVVTLQLS